MTDQRDKTMSWAVMVERNGESIVTLSSNMLAGRDLSDEDEVTVRMAGRHLLAFIGDPDPDRSDEIASLRQQVERLTQERDELAARASTLEDAAFHFQTCVTCGRDGENSCTSGTQFAAFLRGEAIDGN